MLLYESFLNELSFEQITFNQLFSNNLLNNKTMQTILLENIQRTNAILSTRRYAGMFNVGVIGSVILACDKLKEYEKRLLKCNNIDVNILVEDFQAVRFCLNMLDEFRIDEDFRLIWKGEVGF